jgi:hemolysin activation/secretion protein
MPTSAVIQNMGRIFIITWIVVNCSVVTIYAAPTSSDLEVQTQRAQQEQEEQLKRQNKPDVFLEKKPSQNQDTALPEESTAFLIHKLILEGDGAQHFPWAQNMLASYDGRKIGLSGINLIVKRLSEAFIDRGYITSRMVVPEQDLTSGTLKLELVPGRVGEIRCDAAGVQRKLLNAFPIRPGDILNLRQLEQGLEQMKRITSQEVSMNLVPGKNPGDSDVVLTIKDGNLITASISADDSGLEETGKIQLTETLGINNLVGLNDVFSCSVNQDGERKNNSYGTRGNSFSYSIPYGDSTFSITSSHYNYYETIPTIAQPFTFSGEMDSTEFHLTQLLYRDQTSKTSLELGLIKGYVRNYLEGSEIMVQHQDTTFEKIGLSHRRYFGSTTFDIEIDDKQGVPCLGAGTDTPAPPTIFYNMWLVDASINSPVSWGSLQGHYSFSVHGQYTHNQIFGTDFLSIGNRFTVRGFDGEETLSAQQGWYVRNDLGIPIGKSGLEAYTGLDFGAVYGPSASALPGQYLCGAVFGLRSGSKNIHYDTFVGWPLIKPAGFETASPTFGFQVSYQM